MDVKFRKLANTAVTPQYAKPGDAGMDLVAIAQTVNDQYGYIEYYTGIAVEIPEGYVGLIFQRSSISNKDISLTNAVGVIDSGYRGEIRFRYRYPKDKIWLNVNRYVIGDKVGQLVIMPCPQVNMVQVDKLSDSDRGDGGFGSTGN